MPRARLAAPGGRLEVRPAHRREGVEATEVGDPVARQRAVALGEEPTGPRELEEELEGSGGAGEPLVPVVAAPDHRVAQPEGGDRELDRHRRHRERVGADLEDLAAVGEDVVDDRPLADPAQVVGAEHPLVVEDDEPPGPGEALVGGRGRVEGVDDAVVEADHREVVLGHGEVLVVAGSGIRARRRLGPFSSVPVRARSNPTRAGVGADPDGLAHLEVPVVGVELRGHRVGRPRAVQRVEVEGGRTTLEEVGRRDLVAERDDGLVEGEVVVDELTEVGVAGRDVAAAARRARASPARPCARSATRQPGRALRAHPREAELGGGVARRSTASRGLALDREVRSTVRRCLCWGVVCRHGEAS